jgi:hypothetical protein
MSYRIAGIDVHKRMLAVVVADVAVEGEYQFERRQFGGGPDQLRSLAEWLIQREAQEVVMESTAQYWKPVWETLERYWMPACRPRTDASRMSGMLHLAQAQTNRAPRGRKKDFADAERLLKPARRAAGQECSPIGSRPASSRRPGLCSNRSARPGRTLLRRNTGRARRRSSSANRFHRKIFCTEGP